MIHIRHLGDGKNVSAISFRLCESQPRRRGNLRTAPVLLGMAKDAVGRLDVERSVGGGAHGDAVANRVDCGGCRGDDLVVCLASWCGTSGDRAISMPDAVDCTGIGCRGFVVAVAPACA